MKFIYETHLHTNIASACAQANPEDYISFYLHAGFSGIIVTDHFFNGNTTFKRNLSWSDKVNGFCQSYERCKAQGDKQGLSVFFGWEHCFGDDEYLIYGLDKQWLLNHPEVMDWNHHELYTAVHKDGGAMVQAHPYRERDYITHINLHPHDVDGVEVANSGNLSEQDQRAYAYAQKHHLMMTAGSDSHTITDGKDLFGVMSDKKWESINDYVKTLRENKQLALYTTRTHLKETAHGALSKPVIEY